MIHVIQVQLYLLKCLQGVVTSVLRIKLSGIF